MKILALESSAVAASAALCEDEMLLGQTYLHRVWLWVRPVCR